MTQSEPLSANETGQILAHHDIERKDIDGVVQFLLIGCQTDVPNTDVGGRSDPYAVIESSGFSTTTLIKMDTLRPQWNENITLPWRRRSPSNHLCIKLFDRDADTTGASDARDGDDALAHGFVDLRAFGAITFESIAKLDGQRNEGPESESEPTAITEQQNENENETEEQGEQQLAAQNEALRDQELGAQQIAAPANSAVECCEVEPTQNGTWIVKLRATAPVQNASEGFEFVELLIGKPVFRRVTTPPTTRLSEKERRAISFRIPGPGDGYDPKPPRVKPKKSIYQGPGASIVMGTKPPAQVVARITGMSPRACSSPQGIYNRRHANEKRPNVGKLESLPILLNAEQISQMHGVTPLLGKNLASIGQETPRQIKDAAKDDGMKNKPNTVTGWFERFFPSEAPTATLSSSYFRQMQTSGSRRNLNVVNKFNNSRVHHSNSMRRSPRGPAAARDMARNI